MKQKWPKTKVVSIVTNCAICGKETIKKHYEKDINAYLCDDCYNLSDLQKIVKIYEALITPIDPSLDDEECFQELIGLLEEFSNMFGGGLLIWNLLGLYKVYLIGKHGFRIKSINCNIKNYNTKEHRNNGY